MSEHFLDVRLNWFQAMSARYLRATPFFSSNERTYRDAGDDGFEVVVPATSGSDLRALRDWLHQRGAAYKLFARWGEFAADYEIRRRVVGLLFVFEDKEEACLFRLWWAG